jgi:hypothetical protein
MFSRTTVGGVSLPRLLIGTNWFRGFSHTSLAKDKFIKETMTSERIAAVLEVFLGYGIDAIMGLPDPVTTEAARIAQEKTGRKLIYIFTPHFNILPGGPAESEPERVFDYCKKMGATFCFPHQCITDALIDKRTHEIRDYGRYAKMIRDRGMIPGLSTHMPESIVIADKTGIDVESYIQIYNAAGFLMQVEADWVMKVIREAKKPVMTIKPLAAGRLLPAVGLGFVWATIRDCDMVTIGTMTPDEAREVIEISLALLERRSAGIELQKTRSKKSLE